MVNITMAVIPVRTEREQHQQVTATILQRHLCRLLFWGWKSHLVRGSPADQGTFTPQRRRKQRVSELVPKVPDLFYISKVPL